MSQFMTKDQWMDYLAAQIQGDKTIVRTASRLMKSDSGQEIASPYVGLASIRDIIQKHSTTGDKHVCNLGLFIKTKTQDMSVESIIAYISGIVKTIDLGSNVYSVKVLGSRFVAMDDYTESGGDKFSTTCLDLEVEYASTATNTAYPLTSAGQITEPACMAHYKIFALLTSGSNAIQPLGTLIYPSNVAANVMIPANSGSLLIGVASDTPDLQSVYAGDTNDDHKIPVIVDVVTSYTEDTMTLFPTLNITDTVVNTLRSNINLGQAYYIDNVTVIQYTDFLRESGLYGGRISVTIRKQLEYTQE